jgi:dolichyl-phosphate-mannose-protein mannosyltransferase
VAELGVPGQVEERSGSAVIRVGSGEDQDLDPGLEQGPDAHGARFAGGEDGHLRQPVALELAGGGLDGEQDGVGGGVTVLEAAVVVPADHGVIEDGHRANGRPTLVGASAGLGDGLGHKQLVVHRTPSLAEGPLRTLSTLPYPLAVGWSRLDTFLLGTVVVVAAALRLPGLDHPPGFVFDEIFYAQNACLLAADPDVCGIGEPLSNAHPPLGESLIAAGIAVFGYTEVGWRIASALAGILTVALLYVLAHRLLTAAGYAAAPIGAAAAAGLLAVDFLQLVHSRVAMLDGFLTLFVLLAVLCVVLDRDRARDAPVTGLARWALGRPWRLAAGAALGAATAIKWSGAFAAVVVVMLVVAYEIAARRRDGRSLGAATRLAFREEGVRSAILLGLVPTAVYLASYLSVESGTLIGLPWQEGTFWHGVARHQLALARFYAEQASGHHPYESPAWSWLLLKRPVAYWFSADGVYREVVALGNPVTWWPAAVAFVGLTVAWLRRGAPSSAPEAVMVAGVAATYLPWLLVNANRDNTFLWYILPAVPFLYLGLGLLTARAWSRVPGRVLVGVAGSAILVAFLIYWPLLVAAPLAPEDWRRLMLFTDCDRPGAATVTLPDAITSSGLPPEGWCWI